MTIVGNYKFVDKTNTLNNASLRKNKPEYLILHSTNSYNSFDDLLTFHRSRGWSGVGYHLFFSEDNQLNLCRPFDVEGAHALGFNTQSIGLCIYLNHSKSNKERLQISKDFVSELRNIYPNLKLMSHTQSQILFLNELLRKNEIDKEFPADCSVVNPKIFSLHRKFTTKTEIALDVPYPDSHDPLSGRIHR